jgi:hypothetical protein
VETGLMRRYSGLSRLSDPCRAPDVFVPRPARDE